MVRNTEKLNRIFQEQNMNFLVNRKLLNMCLKSRNSRSQLFFKIDVLKNFAIFTGKHLSWNLFLIKQQAFSRAAASANGQLCQGIVLFSIQSCIKGKINLNFYFHISLWCFKSFIKAFKATAFLTSFRSFFKKMQRDQPWHAHCLFFKFQAKCSFVSSYNCFTKNYYRKKFFIWDPNFAGMISG